MSMAKIAITVDRKLLKSIDLLVSKGLFSNRSQAISDALRERIERQGNKRLLKQLSLLDKADEQASADEFGDSESEWPEY